MVKHSLVVLFAHAALAAPLALAERVADDVPEEEVEVVEDDPAFNMFGFNMFGFDMALGPLPIDGAPALAMSIGLSVEHPVFRKTRVFGEYAWVWLLPRGEERMGDDMTIRPEHHASGHRAGLGLRRELTAKGARSTRFFVDGELGGTVTLANDNMEGVRVMPAVFTGLRLGYDLYSRKDDSPSRTFETAFLIRAIGVRDGVGMTFGVGMYWGN
jgi:hypothetical protein